MKKGLLAALAAIVVAALAALLFLSRQTYVVELTEADLQAHLDQGFPLEKGVLIFSLQLRNPKVTLRDGSDRIHFRVDVGTSVRIDGVIPEGTAEVASPLRYVPEKGDLYLSDPDVVLHLDALEGDRLARVNEIANLLLKDFAARRPVYRLTDEDLKQSVARAVLRDVRVEGGVLQIHLGLK